LRTDSRADPAIAKASGPSLFSVALCFAATAALAATSYCHEPGRCAVHPYLGVAKPTQERDPGLNHPCVGE
jgi:hypothetical protein